MKNILYKPTGKEVFIELFFYLIILSTTLFFTYINFLIGLYFLFFVFVIILKSNRILSINNKEIVVLKKYIIIKRIKIENVDKIYCEEIRLRTIVFIDVCVSYTVDNKKLKSTFITYNFLGYISIISFLNKFKNIDKIDEDSLDLINVVLKNEKFESR